jgi:ferredoxin-type protein NapG/ferredoxin-type protein NapH
MERRVTIGLLFGGLASLLITGFTDNKKVSRRLIRPPGALNESEFLATCARCGKCAQVCPLKAIIMGKGDKGVSIGTPYIEPRQAACDLCMDCIPVCPTGALRPVTKEKVRMGTAEINRDTCLAWQGDECKICYTSCPFYNQAIKLEDYKKPVIDTQVCVGCGICERVCITGPASITVKARG